MRTELSVDIRQNIISTAEDLFIRYGFKRVTMDDIARELAISKKTIYQFFEDKNEIVCAATEEHLRKEEEQMARMERESENVIEFLVKMTRMLRQHLATVNPGAIMELQKFFPEGWNIFLRYKEKVFVRSLVQTLSTGQQEGYFRKDFNPEILAQLRMEEVQFCFDNRIFPRERFDFAEVQIQVFRHFIEGIITQKGRELLEEYQKTLSPHENIF